MTARILVTILTPDDIETRRRVYDAIEQVLASFDIQTRLDHVSPETDPLPQLPPKGMSDWERIGVNQMFESTSRHLRDLDKRIKHFETIFAGVKGVKKCVQTEAYKGCGGGSWKMTALDEAGER